MQLKALLAEADALPSAPDAVIDLAQTFENEDASTADVVNAIEADPVLVAQLLRVANSSLFFRGRVIEDTAQAVRLLGLSQTRALVIGLSACESFPTLPEAMLQQYWRVSLNTAEIARHIADVRGGDSDVYISGLLHLIGELAMRVAMPARMAEVDAATPVMALERHKTESKMLGYNYADVGAELTRRWGLPASIVRIIERHRSAVLGGAQDFNAMTVQLASWRARAIELELTADEQAKLFPANIGRALGIKPEDVIGWLPKGQEEA